MSEIKPIIRISNGSKAWQTHHLRIDILKRINLSIHAGESIALFGPSGAGKSTLLHVIGLLTHLDDGELWVDNIHINFHNRSSYEPLRPNFGFVFQGAKLIQHLNVLENVCLPLSLRGIWPMRQKRMARRELAQVGLANRLYHRIDQLSSRELMQVAIARAMVLNPTVVLADEPTGNLDSKTGKEIIDLLFERTGVDRTLILATHNPILATMPNRLVFVKDGRIEPQTT